MEGGRAQGINLKPPGFHPAVTTHITPAFSWGFCALSPSPSFHFLPHPSLRSWTALPEANEARSDRERKDSVTVNIVEPRPGALDFIPASATELLYDAGQIT